MAALGGASDDVARVECRKQGISIDCGKEPVIEQAIARKLWTITTADTNTGYRVEE